MKSNKKKDIFKSMSKDEAIKLAAESADVPKKVAKSCLVKVYKEPQVVAYIEEDE